ncbi:MAG: MBL fold metallo-hydrolase [Halodesulfurarchaeum sp.]|nr:MBL fold metallo-hydrolase [Halodesulfurarchaeum sp.]
MKITCLSTDAETFTANVYLLEGTERTLVDAGAMPGIVEAVSERVDTLDTVVLTHRHSDHIEQLEAIRAAFDPVVYAAAPGDGATVLKDGDTVRIGGESFETVATPGHAPDHLAFVGETAVFTGDVVVYSDGAFEDGSFGRTDLPGADRETLIESLDRLLDRLPPTVEVMYPGHGPSYDGDVRAVIERARSRAARYEPKYPE